MSLVKLDYERITQILTGFIKQEIEKAGFNKVILGLSGGIDSAIVAYLSVLALGSKNVHAVMMPYKSSSQSSSDDAMKCVNELKISYEKCEITKMVDTYFTQFPEANNLRKGNKMARERMSTLYDLSSFYNCLVIGTSNKTELLLGYGTQFGDLASALNPIGDLYKTHIWELAKHLKIPQSIIDKKPSADLWEGQSDEQDFGFSYEVADNVLYQFVERHLSKQEVIELGYEVTTVEKIIAMIKRNQYKRTLPLIAKISSRSIGSDFLYPRDWGL